jgi:hypothetical protein
MVSMQLAACRGTEVSRRPQAWYQDCSPAHWIDTVVAITLGTPIWSSSMHAEVKLPKAFSVQNENEFFPIQHLMARMNPKLMVVEVATGMHKTGGCTVFWGLAYLDGQTVSRQDVEEALAEAGFDFKRGTIQTVSLVPKPAIAG